jgi:poly(A) polymerase
MRFPRYILRLKREYDADGHELYAVGGCVRDRLLARPVGEYDLTTDARPERTRELVARAGPDALYAVGERFGTIGAIFGSVRVEITTYRGERYERDSRKPRVEWGSSLEDDLARRDFTINAIAEEIDDDRLIDPFGGSADLHRRLVRAVGDPDARFEDDPLRLLRAVRFASTLAFELEPGTARSIARCAPQLGKISRERVRDELSRMLTGPAPDRALSLLADLGLMRHILPELLELREVETGGGRHKDIYAHTLRVVRGTPPDLITRWAAVLHDIGKPAAVGYRDGKLHFDGHEKLGEAMAHRALRGLKYDRATVEAVAKVVGLHTHMNAYSPEWTDGAVRRLVRDAGDELQPLLDLSRADITSYRTEKVRAAGERVEQFEERVRRLEEQASIQALRPPLDGNDLMRIFDRPPGPWIAPLKQRLLDLVIEGRLSPEDREAAERVVREEFGGPTLGGPAPTAGARPA